MSCFYFWLVGLVVNACFVKLLLFFFFFNKTSFIEIKPIEDFHSNE